MKKLLEIIPLAITGLMLACFAIGNLLGSYSKIFTHAFSVIGIIMFLLVTLKIISNLKGFIEQVKHPVIASIITTYTMAIMLMSVYLKQFIGSQMIYLWYFSIGLHFIFVINYVFRFILSFNLKKIFPSIFVLLVGIVVASVTAPAFNAFEVGRVLFYFGLTVYILALPLVFYRLIKHKDIPVAARPTIAIIAAPASLCLAGYLSSFETKESYMVYALLTLALILTSAILIYLPKLLKDGFSPAYSAFTFPFVISAISSKKAFVFLQSKGDFQWFKSIVVVEEVIALIIVLYVLVKYITFISKKLKSKNVDKKAA